jgi:hypothetical protein
MIILTSVSKSPFALQAIFSNKEGRGAYGVEAILGSLISGASAGGAAAISAGDRFSQRLGGAVLWSLRAIWSDTVQSQTGNNAPGAISVRFHPG